MLVATLLLGQPLGYVLFALALAFVFVFINGISTGISDSNPISSAFVVSVLIMSALGLRAPIVAMMAASILLVSPAPWASTCSRIARPAGGWAPTGRMQFRYQAVGIVGGAVLCVVMAQLFMTAYPVLRVDTFTHPEARVGGWQSAMTFKFVGAIRGMGHLKPYQITALWIGFGIGFGTEVARKLLRRWAAYGRSSPRAAAARRRVAGRRRAALEPLRLVVGRLLEISTAAWFAAGSLLTSLLSPRRPPAVAPERAATRCPRT